MRKLHITSLKRLAKLNYQGNIEHPRSFCLTTFDRTMVFIVCLLIFGILSIGTIGTYIQHIRNNFTEISDNVPMKALEHHTLNGTHEYHIIFYNSECPHCQKVVPPAYLNNKLSGYKIQYRDVQQPANTTLANKTGGVDNPIERNITYKNHHFSVQQGKLNMLSSYRRNMFVVVYIVLLLVISYIFSYVII